MNLLTFPYRLFSGDSSEIPRKPIVDIKLINSRLNKQTDCESLIDTGADVTLVPKTKMSLVKAIARGRDKIEGFNGVAYYDKHYIQICFDGCLPPVDRMAVYSWDEEYTLLGRDFLKYYCIKLDGMNLQTYIET